jgi:integrase/recombinase XerD
MAAILATCVARSRHDFRAIRDSAILLLLGSTGARVSEVANLTIRDLDLRDDTILVHGKGAKDRLLPSSQTRRRLCSST